MKKILMNALVLGILMSPTLGRSAVIEIQTSGFTFTPSTVNILVGDTIRWQNISGAHTTTNGTGSADPNAGVLWDVTLDLITPVFEHQFTAVGTFPFFCRPHEFSGMTGVVNVAARPANLFDIAATGMIFDPDSIIISAGDQIRWVKGVEEHTTTSGTGSADPNSGVLWDAFLLLSTPTFTLQFDNDGVFQYYCIPHEFDGMSGVVVVGDPAACSCPTHGDPASPGAVDVFDVLQAVSVAFQNGPAVFDQDCPVPNTDISGCTGAVDVFDVLQFVFVAFQNGTTAGWCDPCGP